MRLPNLHRPGHGDVVRRDAGQLTQGRDIDRFGRPDRFHTGLVCRDGVGHIFNYLVVTFFFLFQSDIIFLYMNTFLSHEYLYYCIIILYLRYYVCIIKVP